jgi:hypothetical protein
VGPRPVRTGAEGTKIPSFRRGSKSEHYNPQRVTKPTELSRSHSQCGCLKLVFNMVFFLRHFRDKMAVEIAVSCLDEAIVTGLT